MYSHQDTCKENPDKGRVTNSGDFLGKIIDPVVTHANEELWGCPLHEEGDKNPIVTVLRFACPPDTRSCKTVVEASLLLHLRVFKFIPGFGPVALFPSITSNFSSRVNFHERYVFDNQFLQVTMVRILDTKVDNWIRQKSSYKTQ